MVQGHGEGGDRTWRCFGVEGGQRVEWRGGTSLRRGGTDGKPPQPNPIPPRLESPT